MPLTILIIDRIFLVYVIMLFIRILSSWFPEYSHTRFIQFISFYTDPYLNLFRRFIPPLGMMDISPIFAFISLGLIEAFIKMLVTWLFL